MLLPVLGLFGSSPSSVVEENGRAYGLSPLPRERAVSPTSVHGYLPDDILPTDNGPRTTDKE